MEQRGRNRQCDGWQAYCFAVAKNQKGTFDVRSNMGGIIVSGEITLHGDKIYVQLFQSCFGPDHGFLYRKCNGRKDYVGLTNRYMKWEELLNFDRAVEKIRNEMEN